MQTRESKWVESGKVVVIAIFLAILFRVFLFESYEVQGESMMPSVYDGEHFIVNKISYEFTDPNRFDLIVFHANEKDDYIKRIIGLPGDIVHVKDDTLYINNEPVEEPFLAGVKENYEWELYTKDFAIPEAVPLKHVFVLGDNRPNSLDSRVIGFIPTEEIVGKVDLRIWPLTMTGIMN